MARGISKTEGLSTDDLTEQLATLRDEVSLLRMMAEDMAKTKTVALGDAAKSTVADLRDGAADAARGAKDQIDQAHGQANDLVRNQPATAVVVALGIGFLVGYAGSQR